MYVYMYYEVEL